jgi:hypothetical protein
LFLFIGADYIGNTLGLLLLHDPGVDEQRSASLSPSINSPSSIDPMQKRNLRFSLLIFDIEIGLG